MNNLSKALLDFIGEQSSDLKKIIPHLICFTVIVVLIAQTAPANIFYPQSSPQRSFTFAADLQSPTAPQTPTTKPATTQPAKDLNPQKRSGEAEKEKRKKALQMLDEVLAYAPSIRPVEYAILTEVEGAMMLWKSDKYRATTILKEAVKTLRGLINDEKKSLTDNQPRNPYLQQLRFLVVRKIAQVNPDLVNELFLEKTADGRAPEMSMEWTQEGLSLLSVATELIEKDPKLAARIAEQIFPLGLAAYDIFIRNLAKYDAQEAERLAILVINRFRDSAVPTVNLMNMYSFFLYENNSAKLRDYYLLALATRFRRDLIAQTANADLQYGWELAQKMNRYIPRSLPQWQVEFQNIADEFNSALQARACSTRAAQKHHG
ncbi:MAG: hypothetical protein AB1757_16290 [Acidobacteriota bacterium]